jgi:GMP synthase (glutamine-hydrolysing)
MAELAALLPVKSVGVIGDVHSEDGMTADWVRAPLRSSNKNQQRYRERNAQHQPVIYDITSTPPGTIEWE